MKASLVLLTMLLGLSVVGAQSQLDSRTQGYLLRLFPTAVSFSSENGPPRHFKAYSSPAGKDQKLLGLAFWTTEVEPLERAYDGPIKMIVGMTTNGTLTNVIVVEHHE